MKPLIVANWKMNPSTLKGAKLLFNLVKKGVENIKNVEVVICPPFLYLFECFDTCRKIQKLNFGAQNCFWEEKGAFTGEISPLMLKNLGCEFVIIGHSERRKLGETDEMVNKKIKAAISAKLKVIFCIGETEKERKESKTFKVLKFQVEKGLRGILKNDFKNLIIAYEPIWAIGTGKFCRIPEAKSVNLFIKKTIKKPPVLYGGSVNSKNAEDYIKEAEFQGLLVGGASLDAKEFIQIVKNIARA